MERQKLWLLGVLVAICVAIVVSFTPSTLEWLGLSGENPTKKLDAANQLIDELGETIDRLTAQSQGAKQQLIAQQLEINRLQTASNSLEEARKTASNDLEEARKTALNNLEETRKQITGQQDEIKRLQQTIKKMRLAEQKANDRSREFPYRLVMPEDSPTLSYARPKDPVWCSEIFIREDRCVKNGISPLDSNALARIKIDELPADTFTITDLGITHEPTGATLTPYPGMPNKVDFYPGKLLDASSAYDRRKVQKTMFSIWQEYVRLDH